MKRIRITDPIPASVFREPESARDALVGAELAVDTEAVQRLCAAHPNITRFPDTYEATLDEVIAALCRLGRTEAVAEWRILPPHLIRIPHDCAELIEP